MDVAVQDATAVQIERMNGNCAVCWSEMTVLLSQPEEAEQPGQGQPGKALPCGHAFHESCIKRWLKQCHGWAAFLQIPAPARVSVSA